MPDDPGVRNTTVARWKGNEHHASPDQLIVEEPLEMRIVHGPDRASASISVTMRTPGEDEELALGFLYTERVIESPSHVERIEPCGRPDPATGLINTVRAVLRPDVKVDLDRLRRNVYTTSSCGVCGKTSIEAVAVAATAVQSVLAMDAATVSALPARLDHLQTRFAATGGVHAAALCDERGRMLLLREDVGRHNAVDKVIGAMLRSGAPDPAQSVLVLSGRAGFELVQKAAVAGIPFVVAVGAPTSLSVELAGRMNVTLVGFARDGSFVLYADAARRMRDG